MPNACMSSVIQIQFVIQVYRYAHQGSGLQLSPQKHSAITYIFGKLIFHSRRLCKLCWNVYQLHLREEMMGTNQPLLWYTMAQGSSIMPCTQTIEDWLESSGHTQARFSSERIRVRPLEPFTPRQPYTALTTQPLPFTSSYIQPELLQVRVHTSQLTIFTGVSGGHTTRYGKKGGFPLIRAKAEQRNLNFIICHYLFVVSSREGAVHTTGVIS